MYDPNDDAELSNIKKISFCVAPTDGFRGQDQALGCGSVSVCMCNFILGGTFISEMYDESRCTASSESHL